MAYFPFMIAFLLLERTIPAVLSYFVVVALAGVYLGPAIAMTHALVTVRMRALAGRFLGLLRQQRYRRQVQQRERPDSQWCPSSQGYVSANNPLGGQWRGLTRGPVWVNTIT